MVYVRIIHAPELITRAQFAVGASQEQLGRDAFGCSRRTMSRWVAGKGGPTLQEWAKLVRHVYPYDRAVAAEIAKAMGESLVSLRLEAPEAPAAPAPAGPPPRPAPPLSDLVDSVVCAAAEAAVTTPQAIRPAILAAFDRVASVAISVDDVRTTLRAGTGKKK